MYRNKKISLVITISSNVVLDALFSEKPAMMFAENYISVIPSIHKIKNINTFTYKHNELANSFGFTGDKIHIGVGAHSVKESVPEAVEIAPFDVDEDGNSKTKRSSFVVG